MALSSSPAAPNPSEASWTRWGVLAWLCLAATIAYICRNSIAVAESTIRNDLGLTEKQMGLVISAFFFSYAVVQIPTGWLGHVWGSRRTLAVISIGWSLATASMSLATGTTLLIASRLANGALQAGLFPCCTNTFSKWFPATQRAIASGSLAGFMSLGGAIGAALTGLLIVEIGWRWVFVLYSVAGCLWAVGFYAWFRDLPEQHRGVNSAELELILMGQSQERTREPTEPTPCVGIVRSTAMWWICAQQFFRAAGYMFFASWFATYLQETRDVPIRESGLLTTMPLVAVVVGSLVGGVISDWILARTGNRRLARQGVATTALVACALLIFAAYFVKDALLAVSVISAGSFCFAVSSPTAYAITIDMGGKHVATVFSTMNMSGNIGGMIFPYVVPWFREATGSWESVLLLFGGMFVAAAVCWLFLNPQGTIFDHSMIPARREPRDDDTR